MLVILGAPAAAAAATGRPGAGDRPGPAVLYWAAAKSPVLENAPGSVWRAQPIMVSGASAYRDGEFLYQDYLYDDVGAYPSDAKYAGNAADFVEVRVKPLADATAIRITYNSMLDANAVASTIALGDSASSYQMPHGADTVSPGQVFVTVHGDSGDVVEASTGTVEQIKPIVSTDLARHQTEVRIPYAAFDPRGRVARIAAATGLWDASSGSYLAKPSTAPASVAADVPPGTPVSQGSAFFNVAFRYHESGTLDSSAESAALPTNKSGDISSFFASIDFRKLASAIDDDMPGRPGGVPQSGHFVRILVSHFESGQGRSAQSGSSANTFTSCNEPCNQVPDFEGRLQPYAIWIPPQAPPPSGYGLTLDLHAAGGDYSAGTPIAADLAARGTGSIVVTPEARGVAQWYWGVAAADVFEVWADVARHYKLDPGFSDITGWSMGGYGTYKLAAQFPDLFARALPDIGCPSAAIAWPGGPTPVQGGPASAIRDVVASYRNLPIFSTNGAADPLCMSSAQEEIHQALSALGYRYDWRAYAGSHFVYYPSAQESTAFLGNARVNPNPPHVTYVYNAAMDEPRWGINSDHAYWISGLRLSDTGSNPPVGTIDVFSHGFGVGDPTPSAEQTAQSTTGTPYVDYSRTWAPAPPQPARDELDITATNIRQVTIDVARAQVDCAVQLVVRSDVPLAIHLAGCPRAVRSRGVAAETSRRS